MFFGGVHASFRGCFYSTSTRWWVGEHGIHNLATAHFEKRSLGHTLQEEGKRSTKPSPSFQSCQRKLCSIMQLFLDVLMKILVIQLVVNCWFGLVVWIPGITENERDWDSWVYP